MGSIRILNDGSWSKPPLLTAARKVLMDALKRRVPSVPLDHMASFVNGTSYRRDLLTPQGQPIIRISNITDPLSPMLTTIEAFEEKFLVEPGDLLVSWSASFKSIIWPGPAGVLNQHIFKVAETEGNERSFIRHSIEAAFEEMQQRVVGIGMMHLRRGDFLGHRVPCPDFNTQQAVARFLDWIEFPGGKQEPTLPHILGHERRIVARIEALAAKVQEARQLRRQTDEEVRALLAPSLNRLFGDPYRHETTKLKKDDFRRLDEAVTDVADGPHVTPRYVETGIPFVTVLNITSGKVNFARLKYITLDDHRQFQRRARVEKGDVLITKDGSIGIPCFVDTDKEFSFFVSVALVKPKRDLLDGEFLTWALRAPYLQRRMKERSRGDMIRHLVLREIRDLVVPIPPLADQRRIVAELDALHAKVDALKKLQAETAAELDALMPSILDKAFRGEL